MDVGLADNDFLDYIEVIFEDEGVPRRYIRDFENPLERFSELQFKKRYRFSKDVVTNVILPLVQFERRRNRRGLPLSPMLQILISLRFYATGNFQVRGTLNLTE